MCKWLPSGVPGLISLPSFFYLCACGMCVWLSINEERVPLDSLRLRKKVHQRKKQNRMKKSHAPRLPNLQFFLRGGVLSLFFFNSLQNLPDYRFRAQNKSITLTPFGGILLWKRFVAVNGDADTFISTWMVVAVVSSSHHYAASVRNYKPFKLGWSIYLRCFAILDRYYRLLCGWTLSIHCIAMGKKWFNHASFFNFLFV